VGRVPTKAHMSSKNKLKQYIYIHSKDPETARTSSLSLREIRLVIITYLRIDGLLMALNRLIYFVSPPENYLMGALLRNKLIYTNAVYNDNRGLLYRKCNWSSTAISEHVDGENMKQLRKT